MKAINQWRNFLMESDLSSTAKLIGFCMAQYYRPGYPTYPSQTTLMQDSGFNSRNTIRSGIKELEKAGLIEVVEKRIGRNRFKSHCYFFIGSLGDHVGDHIADLSNDRARGEHELKKEKKEKRTNPRYRDTTISKVSSGSGEAEHFLGIPIDELFSDEEN